VVLASVEPRIGIRLHQPGKACQMLLGCSRHDRANRRTPPPAGQGRQKAGRRAHRSIPGRCGSCLGQQPHRGVVGMDAFTRKDMGSDRLDQLHQRRRRGADPVGQRGDVEIDAFPGIGRALTAGSTRAPSLYRAT